jgi:CS domain
MAFVSDGNGTIYVLQVKDSGSSDVLGIFTLSPTSMEMPFRIHSVHRLSPTVVVAILSSRHYAESADTESQGKQRGTHPSPDFDIWAVKIELLSLGPRGSGRPLDVIWRRRGQDVPIYTSYEESLKSFILIGGSIYREVDRQPSSAYEPSPDEIVPIPRADENLDSQASESPKPLPYAWSQTQDSVTITIPLPSSTPKSNIKVTFSPRTLTVHIDSDVLASVPIPRYSAKLLWDGISSSTSYWTWDREAEHSFGLLTLYLDKQHEGTKWSQIFAPGGIESNLEDIEVPETLDPSELWHIREALEKYTTSLREGDDGSGLGLGRGVPSLAEGEMDMEVDESIGREAYLTWVGEDGFIPPWWKESTSIPFQLLATPMPGSKESNISLVVKNSLDGIVHSLISNATSGPEWTHTSTFSALAFVLASKRDTRFTYHIPGNAVFAFEGGVRDRGGNVYIYRAAPIKEKWAKQAILKVDDGFGGSLLGVGAVKFSSEASILACLTEGELVLIKGS